MYIIRLISEFLLHAGKTIFRSGVDPQTEKIKNILSKNFSNDPSLAAIKEYYACLIKDSEPVKCTSPGAGSKKSGILTLARYARNTSVTLKRGNLLYGIVKELKPELIIELGTALGISAMYMAEANPLAKIITIEGNAQIAERSANNFRKYGYNNVKVINRLFDDAINDLTKEINLHTLVFIDGNHRFDTTLTYVNLFSAAPIIILDDIRWSADMIKAWRKIRNSEVKSTIIDLFVMGIIIKPGFGKKFSFWL
jgi:predicted O-methyltransferase YrrM